MFRRLLHNGLLAVGLATCSLAAHGTGTARADAAQVTVVAAGGGQQTLSLEALGEGDVSERPYTLRSTEGESTLRLGGFSPAAILAAAGIDPYGFSSLEVQRPAGGSVLLSRHQALDPSAFPEGPPVVYATAAGTGFLRPSAGAGDVNAPDSFEAPQGLTLVLRNDSPLRVSAHASTVRTRPGQPVTFSAVVERAGAGEKLSYSWYFDDGSSSTGPRTRHRFAKRGSYDVIVGVTTPGDDVGASAVVTVQVGPPLGGPDRKGGGRNEDAGAPDHGAASGGGPDGTTGSGPASTGAKQTTPTPAEPDERSRRSQPRQAPEGQQISGVLLSSSTAAAPSSTAAARSGTLSESDGGSGLPGAALGLLATAALLGLGVLVESRGPSVATFATKGPERTI
jgi:PKD domain-containing protein